MKKSTFEIFNINNNFKEMKKSIIYTMIKISNQSYYWSVYYID